MQNKADVEAMFEFTESKRVFEGYRPSHLIKEDYLTTGVHSYYNLNNNSNQKIMGTITFISPEEYPYCLWIGKKIAMYEGRNLVGYATVTKIFNPQLLSTEQRENLS